MKMTRCLLGLTAALLLSSAALSADLPYRPVTKAPEAAAVSYRWDGSYIGGYVGAQQGKSNTNVDGWTDRQPVQKCYTKYEGEQDTPVEQCYDLHHEYVSTNYPATSSNGNVIGVTGGLYGGYNWQQGRAILGFELDGGLSGARDYTTIYAVNSAHRMPWNFNVTARAGYLLTPSTLLYAKGGLAVLNQRSEIIGPSGAASEDKTKAGWTVGGGIEQANFLAGGRGRVELMYTKVSDQTVAIPGASTTLNGGSFAARVGLAWPLN